MSAPRYATWPHHHPDPATRTASLARYEYLVPIIKGWSTEMAQDVTRDGVQIHGGMGFIGATGAAQHYRDAKILTIYEGTTAIQANDLVGRKTARDGGATARSLLAEVHATEGQLAALAAAGGTRHADFAALALRLSNGGAALEAVLDYVGDNMKNDVKGVFAGSVPYLRLAGIVLGGWQMARAAIASRAALDAGAADAPFYDAKIGTARLFADHILSQAPGLASSIVDGSNGVMALHADQF